MSVSLPCLFSSFLTAADDTAAPPAASFRNRFRRALEPSLERDNAGSLSSYLNPPSPASARTSPSAIETAADESKPLSRASNMGEMIEAYLTPREARILEKIRLRRLARATSPSRSRDRTPAPIMSAISEGRSLSRNRGDVARELSRERSLSREGDRSRSRSRSLSRSRSRSRSRDLSDREREPEGLSMYTLYNDDSGYGAPTAPAGAGEGLNPTARPVAPVRGSRAGEYGPSSERLGRPSRRPRPVASGYNRMTTFDDDDDDDDDDLKHRGRRDDRDDDDDDDLDLDDLFKRYFYYNNMNNNRNRANNDNNNAVVSRRFVMTSTAIALDSPEWRKFNADFASAMAALRSDKDYPELVKSLRQDTDSLLAKSLARLWSFWKGARDRGSTDKLFALFDTYQPAGRLNFRDWDGDRMLEYTPRQMLWSAVRLIHRGGAETAESAWLKQNFPKFSDEIRKIRGEVQKMREKLLKDSPDAAADSAVTSAAERGRRNLLRATSPDRDRDRELEYTAATPAPAPELASRAR